MLGISAAPAVFQLAGLFLLPETKPKRADAKGKSSILWRQLKRKSVWKQLHIGRVMKTSICVVGSEILDDTWTAGIVCLYCRWLATSFACLPPPSIAA